MAKAKQSSEGLSYYNRDNLNYFSYLDLNPVNFLSAQSRAIDLCCSSWRMNRDSILKVEARWGSTDTSPLLSRKEVTQEIYFSELQGV